MNCYKCSAPLTKQNSSEEHLLHNFLGGHMKSTQLLCRTCNEEFGNTIDKELREQIGFFCDVLVGKTDRGKEDNGVELESASGTIKKIGLGFKPKPVLTINIPGGKTHTIQGKDEQHLKLIVEKRKKELEPKFGEFTLTEGMEDPPKERFYFKNKLSTKVGEVGFGGIDYNRAIGKILLNFYLTKCKQGPDPAALREFVCGRTQVNVMFPYFPQTYQIHEIDQYEFSHVIKIRGEQETSAVYGYVELFNSEKFICIISDDYQGDDFEYTYVHDCLTGKPIDKKVNLDLQKHHIGIIKYISSKHMKQREICHNELLLRIEALQDVDHENIPRAEVKQ